jgi:hypothetical protein
MRQSYTALGLICVWLSTTAIVCRSGPAPVPGERSLSVPHFQQPPESFWCGPASVQMWQGWRFGAGSVATQTAIFNWMSTNFPGEASQFGVSPRVIALGAQQYVGFPISEEIYAGPDEERRGLADLSKNIYVNDPVIAIAQRGFHAEVVIGVTWTETETASPTADFVVVNDPRRYAKTYWTVNDWLSSEGNACTSGRCNRYIMRSGRRSFALSELAEFDYLGGTYSGPPPAGASGRYKVNGYGACYWDANDSGFDQCSPTGPTGRYKWDPSGCYWDPNDSGADQCSPSPAASSRLPILKSLLSRATPRGLFSKRVAPPTSSPKQALQRTSGQAAPPIAQGHPRRNTTVPRPWGTSREDVASNFYASVRQLRLDRMPGLDRLTQPNSGWIVGDILPVTSLIGESPYYLLHVVDVSGRIVGSGLVNAEGYLLGYEDSQHVSPPRPSDFASARAALGSKLPGVSRSARYVHAPGTLEPGASRFAPLVQIERGDGIFFVNAGGRVYRETGRMSRDAAEARAAARPVLLRQNDVVSELDEIR